MDNNILLSPPRTLYLKPLAKRYSTFFFFFSFQTTKGITAVNLTEFANNVSDLATKFQTEGIRLSGNDQAKAFVSKGVPLLLILPFIASGQKKVKVRLPRGSKF